MPFKRGNKHGGKRANAGRKSKTDLEIQKEAGVIAREFIEAHVDPILKTYLGLAAGQVVKTKKGNFKLFVDPPTTRHAIDKLIPNEDIQGQRHVTINFVQFNRTDNPTQLHTQDISAAVLEIDAERNEKSGEGVAPTKRKGQDRLKFHNF